MMMFSSWLHLKILVTHGLTIMMMKIHDNDAESSMYESGSTNHDDDEFWLSGVSPSVDRDDRLGYMYR